jgi:hypothetical protein
VPVAGARTPIGVIIRIRIGVRIWAVIIRMGINIIAWPADHYRRRRGRFLIHVEINTLRDSVSRAEPFAGGVGVSLSVLICCNGKGLNDVLRIAEAVKGAIALAENLKVNGCVANEFAVGFNSSARFRSLDQDIVSDSSFRSFFNTRRKSFTASKQAREGCEAGENEILRIHVSNSS